MQLEDKLYKSSELCNILGVSLRTLYRYIEDGKLESVQLASGRHRFTKEQIENFLSLAPAKKLSPKKEVKEMTEGEGVEEKPEGGESFTSAPEVFSQPRETEGEKEEVVEEEPSVDEDDSQTSRDEEAGEREVSQDEEKMSMDLKEEEKEEEEEEEREREEELSTLLPDEGVFSPEYYKCPFDDLRVIAKLIKRAGENASADYAFTGSAGLSLFYPIKAFDKIHFHVSPDQIDFWKLRLQLDEASKDEANVVLIKADSVEVFQNAGERGGLKHVSIERLKEDLRALGMDKELEEFERKGY